MEKKRLYRSQTNQIIAGVCGGLGEYFEVDPTIIRIIFVILTVWGGAGILLYIVGILVIPYPEGAKPKGKQQSIDKELKEKAAAMEVSLEEQIRDGGGSKIIGFILIFLGIFFLLKNFIPWFDFHYLWPLLLIIIGLLVIIGGKKGLR